MTEEVLVDRWMYCQHLDQNLRDPSSNASYIHDIWWLLSFFSLSSNQALSSPRFLLLIYTTQWNKGSSIVLSPVNLCLLGLLIIVDFDEAYILVFGKGWNQKQGLHPKIVYHQGLLIVSTTKIFFTYLNLVYRKSVHLLADADQECW